jgi:RNase P protein component
LRRRLRAAVDEVASDMAPGAYLISPDRDAVDVGFTELTQRLRHSLQAAGAIRGDLT